MTPLEKLKIHFASEMEATNKLIYEQTLSQNAPRIADICAHIIGAGGKQLRPLLPITVANIFNYNGQDHIRLASTVELIHVATLLHDDVVDKSKKRRNKTTANVLWDNKSSILVGDYLFARAFQLMVEIKSFDVLRVLSDASATIAEGEVIQMIHSGQISIDIETHLQIIRAKTAALFSAATKSGGLVAGATPAQISSLWKFGDAIGICFQLVDDWLDYAGTQAIGKNTGDDFADQKITLPVLLSVAKADKQEKLFWERTLGKGDQNSEDFEHALAIMHKNGALEEAKKTALEWAQHAKDALNNMPQHPTLYMLDELADYIVARIN